MRKATHGVILVSFGSIFRALPGDLTYCNVLRSNWRVKGTLGFACSYAEAKTLSMPTNVIVSPYLSQNDLLGHSIVAIMVKVRFVIVLSQ